MQAERLEAIMIDSGLDGQVALVTGAAGGIGSAICGALADHGVTIAAVDVNAAKLVEEVAMLSARGCKAAGFPTDVADGQAVATMVSEVERELGPIGILTNVAGVMRTGSILGMSAEDWAAVFAVNTAGVFHVSQAVSKRMVERRHGSIITVASNAGIIPRMNMAAYCASKAATILFTKCLGLELASQDIRCNVVSPGSTDTTMLRSMWDDPDDAQATKGGSLAAFRIGIPLAKLAQPADIADAVVFLASDQAGHITMHNMCVDGGAALGC